MFEWLCIFPGNLSQLGVLSLRDNKLSYLPSEVGNCKELHVLDVSGNRLVEAISWYFFSPQYTTAPAPPILY